MDVIRGACNRCYPKSGVPRLDGESDTEWLARRKGTGRDPKNRKKGCASCGGSGGAMYCATCGEQMLCMGRGAARPERDVLRRLPPWPMCPRRAIRQADV